MTALLALGFGLHVCRAAEASPSPLPDLFDYLTALAHNQTFYYEPADAEYYLKINNNSIIEFNGTFYEDLNGTFYKLEKEANGTFILPANDTAITESSNVDGAPCQTLSPLLVELVPGINPDSRHVCSTPLRPTLLVVLHKHALLLCATYGCF